MLLKNLINKFLPKWFSWHILPDPHKITIYSLYEIVLYFAIFLFCIIIYGEINTVPYREEIITIETLDKIKWMTNPEEGTPVYAEVEYYLPMSANRHLIKDTANLIISQAGFFPSIPESENSFNHRWNAYCDSIREENLHFTSVYDPELFEGIVLQDKPFYMVSAAINKNKDKFQEIVSEVDSITNVKWPDLKILNRFYIEARQSIVNNIRANLNYSDNDFEEIINPEDTISDYSIYRYVKHYKEDNYLIQKYYEVSNLPCSMNLCVPDSLGITMGDPGWLALFDISQSYFKININSYSIDQITFKINFGGAVELSEIYPVPDKITMNGFEFTNQAKMMYIRENGLLFHAHFKEFQNRQTIRLFFVTAIISSLFMIFIVFIVLGLFLVRNAWINAHKSEQMKRQSDTNNNLNLLPGNIIKDDENNNDLTPQSDLNE